MQNTVDNKDLEFKIYPHQQQGGWHRICATFQRTTQGIDEQVQVDVQIPAGDLKLSQAKHAAIDRAIEILQCHRDGIPPQA